MLKSCKYCMRIHDSKFDCGKKPKRQKPNNGINKFRWSRKWREKAQQIKERDKYLCQLAIRENPPRYIYTDLEVHHIVPIEEDWDLRLDDDNLITLSEEYHEKAERGEITREELIRIAEKNSDTPQGANVKKLKSADTTCPYRCTKHSHIRFLKYYGNVKTLLRKELILMPTPPKPFTILKNEKKSHRTKAELKQREQGEKALVTGTALKERPEVKNNPVAHKEFLRLNKLLKSIEKNDAIYEPIINRYCTLQAECIDIENKREIIYKQAGKLEAMLDKMGDDADFEQLRAVVNDIAKIYGSMIALDKQVQTKRKMLLDIEKENVMTIAAALRSIPKNTDKEENPLLKALRD